LLLKQAYIAVSFFGIENSGDEKLVSKTLHIPNIEINMVLLLSIENYGNFQLRAV